MQANIVMCAAVQTGLVFVANTGFPLAMWDTALFNLLVNLPVIVWACPQHCRLTEPAGLDAYLAAAAGIKRWVMLAAPLASFGLAEASSQTPLGGQQACVVLNLWLPILFGMVLPTCLLAVMQRSWHAKFEARQEDWEEAPLDLTGRSSTVTATVMGVVLLQFACVLWLALEGFALAFAY